MGAAELLQAQAGVVEQVAHTVLNRVELTLRGYRRACQSAGYAGHASLFLDRCKADFLHGLSTALRRVFPARSSAPTSGAQSSSKALCQPQKLSFKLRSVARQINGFEPQPVSLNIHILI